MQRAGDLTELLWRQIGVPDYAVHPPPPPPTNVGQYSKLNSLYSTFSGPVGEILVYLRSKREGLPSGRVLLEPTGKDRQRGPTVLTQVR